MTMDLSPRALRETAAALRETPEDVDALALRGLSAVLEAIADATESREAFEDAADSFLNDVSNAEATFRAARRRSFQ